MGNNDSSPQPYHPLPKIIHPILGQIAHTIDHNKKNKYFIKQYLSQDPQDHKQQLKKLKHRKIKNNKYVLNILAIQDTINHQFCSNHSKIYICFDYFQSDLYTIYTEKTQQKKYFTQQQLFQIIKACISALIYIQDNGLKHYHLSKKSIFFVSKQLKLIDTSLTNKSHPYFQILANQQVSDDVFLAPELLEELKKQSFDPYFSSKTDIYSLGVLILHLACLQTLASYYDYDNMEVDSQSLIYKIQKIKYSNNLKDLLRSMIEVNEQKRPGLISIRQFLQNMPKKDLMTNRSVSLKQTNRMSSNKIVYVNKPTEKHVVSRQSQNLSNRNLKYHPKEIALTENSSKARLISKKLSNIIKENMTRNSDISSAKQNNMSHHTSHIKKNTQFQLQSKKQNTQTNQKYKTIQSYNQSPILKIQSSINRQPKNFGKIEYHNQTYFQGQLINNVPNGNGNFYSSKGKLIYSGGWKNSLYHGTGTLVNQNCIKFKNPFNFNNFSNIDSFWIKYDGQFLDNKKHGFGTLYLGNDQKFLGKFEENRINGFGSFYQMQGKVINGQWQNNLLKKKFD